MIHSSDLDQLIDQFLEKYDWESHYAAITLRALQNLYEFLDVDNNGFEMDMIKRKGIYLALKEYLSVETDFSKEDNK